jgi:hypothetical protein
MEVILSPAVILSEAKDRFPSKTVHHLAGKAILRSLHSHQDDIDRSLHSHQDDIDRSRRSH